MLDQKVRIEISPTEMYVELTVKFIISYAQKLSLKEEKIEELQKACRSALALVLEKNKDGKSGEPIVVEVENSDSKLTVHILNRGIPILENKTILYEAFRSLDTIFIENKGRLGQSIVVEIKLGKEVLKKLFKVSEYNRSQVIVQDEEIVIRKLKHGEERALSELFYFVYGYNYINEFVYYPEKIQAMIEEGRLTSIVAVLPDGRLVGHVGLVKSKDSPPVYEAALGLVDPVVKSRGLFKKIFEKTMEVAHQIPMNYCFFDFVTNHDRSQKLINRYGTCDMAIFVGCQDKITQAKLEEIGIGIDSNQMERYTILFSILPMVEYPFGKEIFLPSSLGESLGFLLESFHLKWIPSPRFCPLPSGGNYKIQYHPSQSSVVFDLFEPGKQAVQSILKEWEELLRNGFQYAAVEVPLEVHGGIGILYDMLAEHGFFVAGFIPYRLSDKNLATQEPFPKKAGDKLGFRFQVIAPTKVAFEHIKVHSENARKLLEIIREDYERNKLI